MVHNRAPAGATKPRRGSRTRALCCVRVATTEDAAESVAELICAVLGAACAIFTDAESRATSVSAYCERRDWSDSRRTALAAGLRRLRVERVVSTAPRIRVRPLRREDWAESWKRHFKPIEIGASLLIRPSWSRRRARPGQCVVVLDPGLSFGTGQHATTRFCLEQLAAAREPAERQSFLDVGTGSGILAIAAAKLDYAPVEALDFDPDAVRIARSNTRKNRVAQRVQTRQADLMKLPKRSARRFDVVCANLTHDLLISGKRRILARLAPGGRLVLAGILRKQFASVRAAYENPGLRLVERRAAGEWMSGAFRRLARSLPARGNPF